MEGTYSSEELVTIELKNQEKGTYLVYIEADWNVPEVVNSLVFATQCD